MLQIARVGVVLAALRFDPRRGARFSTYAWHYAMGEVRHHIRSRTTLVRADARCGRRKRPPLRILPLKDGLVAGPEAFEVAEARADLKPILSQLSARDRKAIEMHFVRDMKYAAIAKAFGVKYRSAFKIVGRALRAARRKLMDFAYLEPPNTLALLDPGPAHSRPMSPLAAEGLVLHSTADPGATARQVRDYFNSHRGASAHVAVDWSETLVAIPWRYADAEVAWHAGPTANGRYLGMELCESTDRDQFEASYARWTGAAAAILKAYGWPCDDAHLWSHARISATFKETDHTDPLPYLLKWGVDWMQVLADIHSLVQEPTTQEPNV